MAHITTIQCSDFASAQLIKCYLDAHPKDTIHYGYTINDPKEGHCTFTVVMALNSDWEIRDFADFYNA